MGQSALSGSLQMIENTVMTDSSDLADFRGTRKAWRNDCRRPHTSKQQRQHQIPNLGSNYPMYFYMMVTDQLEQSFARKSSKVTISHQCAHVTRKISSLGCFRRSVDSRLVEVILNLYSDKTTPNMCPILSTLIQGNQSHREDLGPGTTFVSGEAEKQGTLAWRRERSGTILLIRTNQQKEGCKERCFQWDTLKGKEPININTSACNST